MLNQIIKDLNLKDNAGLVYEALLGQSPQSAIELSRQLNISRMSVYNLANDLIKEGLVVKRGNVYFAETPARLLKNIEKEEARLSKQRAAVEELINSHSKINIQTYAGEAGLVSLNNELSKEKVASGYITMNADLLPDFLKSRRSSKKFDKNKLVIFSNKKNGEEKQGESVNIFAHDQKSFASLLVFGNRVAIYSVPKNRESYGLLINDEGLAKFLSDLIDRVS